MPKPVTYLEQIIAAIKENGPKLSLHALKRYVAELREVEPTDATFQRALRVALEHGVKNTRQLVQDGGSYRIKGAERQNRAEAQVANAPAWMRSSLVAGTFRHPEHGACRVLEVRPNGLVKKFATLNGRLTMSVSAKGTMTSARCIFPANHPIAQAANRGSGRRGRG